MDKSSSNQEQIEYWNEKGGPKWVVHQEALDAQIGPHGDAVIEAAAIAPGEAVLDIGCGCGGTTLKVAALSGARGRAVGVDISAPMLALARDRAERGDVANAQFIQADAQDFVWGPPAYDLAISRFGVMFFADPTAAFSNIRRALKPGGRLAFACWRPPQENPWVMLPMMEVAKRITMPAPPAPDAPGPFAFADRSRVERILGDAGFTQIAVKPLDLKMRLGPSSNLEDSVDFVFEIGPLSRVAAEMDESTRAEVRESILKLFSTYQSDEGVFMPSAAWVVTARNT